MTEKCEVCKTNDVNKTKHFCENCWNYLHNLTDGNMWVLVVSHKPQENNEEWKKMITYYIMLVENGHNGFFLKKDYEMTQKQEESCLPL